MNRVTNAEPDPQSRNDMGSNEKRLFPAIGTPEHAALVEAIKVNFPEIYHTRETPGSDEKFVQPLAWSPSFRPPRCA
jgi:hypothetical protein